MADEVSPHTDLDENGKPYVPVSGVACTVCKNYFWVQHVEIQPPAFCPFCGIRFTDKKLISDEDMESKQVL